jgi:hypothetical protein
MREEKNIFQQYPFAQKDYPQYTRKQKQKKNTGEKEHVYALYKVAKHQARCS